MISNATMRQATIRTPTSFEIETVPRPTLQADDEIIIRTTVSGICSGDLMEWYLAKKVGTVLGHEVVGIAVELGAAVSHIDPGDLVFVHHHAPCMSCAFCARDQFVQCATWRTTSIDPGGMAEYIRVPGQNVHEDSFEIGDVSPEVGVFIEPLACSVKCLQLTRPEQAERAIIIGCGIMGLLNIAAARALGTKEIWAVEPHPSRAEMADRIGADRVWHPDELAGVAERSNFDGADYVVVGPGFPPVIEQATKFVRPGGDLLLFTPTPAGARTELDLGDLYFREIRVIPSYSCGPIETRRAYDLLRTGKVDPRPIVTHRFPLDEIQTAYNTAKAGGEALKVLVEFPESNS